MRGGSGKRELGPVVRVIVVEAARAGEEVDPAMDGADGAGVCDVGGAAPPFPMWLGCNSPRRPPPLKVRGSCC